MRQLMASSEFKKPRLERLNKYWRLYDGKVDKKLRQLFNVAIPVFPGMIDTLNAEYDERIQLTYKRAMLPTISRCRKIQWRVPHGGDGHRAKTASGTASSRWRASTRS